MDPFVSTLHQLCRQHPTRAKWVFVPTHGIGRTLGDRLVLEGCNWANLRFVTPLDIAVRMGAPFLVERGIDPSEEGLGPALVMRLLLALPETDAYFRPLASQPPLAQALWTTIREVRLAGLTAADLLRAWPSTANAAKGRELAALLTAYEAYLAESGRGDVATVFQEATRHPDWCPIAAEDCWTAVPDVVWAPLQTQLIDLMPGERIVPATLDLPDVPVPRRLRDAPVERIAADRSAPLAFLLAADRLLGTEPMAPLAIGTGPRKKGRPHDPAQQDLFATTTEPRLDGPVRTTELFHAGGREAEVEEVFRRILQSGRRLDEVEIVCASEGYTALVWEKAMRYDWPVTLAAGLPVTLTRPGRALVGFAEWIEDDFSAGLLRKLLQSGDMGSGLALQDLTPSGLALQDLTPSGLAPQDLTPSRAARLLVKAQAAWGRATYRLSLGRLARASRTRAMRDDVAVEERERLLARADETDALARWIDELIASIPAPADDGRIDLQLLVSCAERFVSDCASRASALDHLAATALGSAIAELRALTACRCTLAEGLRFLRERVESLTIGADRARPGHLHVSPVSRAGFSGRARIFVTGLEEGRVFPASFEDPILLDEERAAISPALVRSTDRTDEAVFATVARLASISARADGHLTLSYSCRDVREFRQTYASWLLLQAFRVTTGAPHATYKDLHDHLGAPASCVPQGASAVLSASRWWLRGLRTAGGAGRAAVLRQYPSLAAGVRADADRRSDRFTEYDGRVPEAGVVLDPARPDRIVSPTQLEEAAECPFRYFLRRGLHVDAIESGDREKDTWLDPLIRGSLLHDLYAEFLRRCRKEARRVSIPVDRDWLVAQGIQTLAALAREMPPPSAEVEERESHAFLDDLALFAAAEAELEPARTPVGFEVPFGRREAAVDAADDDEPLRSDEPITIDLGGGLTFRVVGRIDRIDQIAPSTFEIVDYKTGGYWPQDWEGTFAGGRRLQHALYGLAAVELLRRRDRSARVAGAHYYFSSAKGLQTRKTIAAPARDRLAAVLGDLRAVIASGLFIHAADDRACKWCDFGHACGRDAGARAEPKQNDPLLDPYRRLAAHE